MQERMLTAAAATAEQTCSRGAQEHCAHRGDVFGIERDPVDSEELVSDPDLPALLRWCTFQELGAAAATHQRACARTHTHKYIHIPPHTHICQNTLSAHIHS